MDQNKTRRLWSKEEDQCLRDAVAVISARKWKKIAERVAYLLTHSRTHSLILSLTHSLTHCLTYSPSTAAFDDEDVPFFGEKFNLEEEELLDRKYQSSWTPR